MKIYTLVGVPGSGKSTFAKNHTECVVISTDEIRQEVNGNASCQDNTNKVYAIAFERVQKALDENKDVIFDATNITRRNRKTILGFNAEHVAIVMDTPIEVCKERNAKRERHVPNHVIDRMHNKMQMPTLEEGYTDIIVIKG